MGNTILLADKSITIQKIVELTFADDNYVIKSVSDGQTALDIIPELHPDLILADVSLPQKSGYELCRTLRTHPAYSSFVSTPVILLAGIYETMDEERLRQVEEKVAEVGANGFLSKPFDTQILTLKVKELITGKAPAKPMEADIFAEGQATTQMTSEDSERTMMIPGGVSSNMFAEMPPFEEQGQSTVEAPRAPVDIDSVKPVDEPVFDPDQPPAESSIEDEKQEQPGRFLQSSAFGGRKEEEFDMEQEAENDHKEGFVEGPTLILSSADEPFGDAFESGMKADWASTGASEEEAPFGMPEMPPAAETKIVEEQEPAPSPFIVESKTAVPEPESEPAAGSEFVAGRFEEDTWPGVPPAHSGQPAVEELFEAEESRAQAASREAAESVRPLVVEEVKASVPGVAPAEITDELVDRIAERVVARLSERVVSEIVWQVVPDLAEKMIRRELEKLNAGEEP